MASVGRFMQAAEREVFTRTVVVTLLPKRASCGDSCLMVTPTEFRTSSDEKRTSVCTHGGVTRMAPVINVFSRAVMAFFVAAFVIGSASAATTARLPAWACDHPDALFVDGFAGATARQRLPSGGSGGPVPGSFVRTVTVPGYGTRSYYVHVPTGYAEVKPVPLLIALHGAAGSQAAAHSAAEGLRDDWRPSADAGSFLVVAPVAGGTSGGWIVPPPDPSDYDVIAAVIADVEAAYDVDQSRRIGWGFSAGGHVMHDLVFNQFSDEVNVDSFAAVAIHAGAMQALACQSTWQCEALVAAMPRRLPMAFVVGDGDPMQPYVQTDHARLLSHGWSNGVDAFWSMFGGGHTYAPAHLEQVWAWLCPFQVLP